MKQGLILFAGIGGFRHGVRNFPGWHWTAVELDPAIASAYKALFPDDEVIVADAHEYLRQHAHEFDFIQSSPPCQTHSRIRYGLGVCAGKSPHVFPDAMLMQEIIFLAKHPNLKLGAKWLIENVKPYYESIVKIAPQYRFCTGRHLCWSNCDLTFVVEPKIKNLSLKTKSNKTIRMIGAKQVKERLWFDANQFMGIDWKTVGRNMFEPELSEAVFREINKSLETIAETA